MADAPLDGLEQQRDELYAQLAATGDFRRGSINETYRRCGKPNCACAAEDHPGHGPRYLWTKSVRGKTRGRQLAGAEVDKVRAELARYREFAEVAERIVEVNEAICEARPVTPSRAEAQQAGSEVEKGGSRTG